VRNTRWLPALLMMFIIFLVSATPGKVINSVGLGREVYHVNGHFILFFLLCFAYYKATKSLALSWIYTSLYAFFDEYHQKFVPLRSSSVKDIFVDILAATVAILIIWKLQPNLPKKLKNWLKK
jgi:VanZ family protein